MKKNKIFLSGDHIIQMIDPRSNDLIVEGSLDSFIDNNLEDEEVLVALYELKVSKLKEKLVPTGQGYFLLKPL